tara:strand:+ start:1845 stop:3398 length:1554 start_codon:yes stop_codon:yes gene_type:complete
MKYKYNEHKANKAVAFIEKFCTHTKGELGGKPFILEEFQKEQIIKPIFGWVDKDGFRKYRSVYIEIPRKNGKSNLCAAIVLYQLFCSNESGQEIISAAADRNQASIVFQIARNMILNNKELNSRCKIYRNSITIESTGSFYKAISAESNTAHGLNISTLIFDELHTQRNSELVDTLTTATGARREPLQIFITTAGYDKNSICYKMSEYATKVRDGIIDDDTFLPVLFRAETEDDWKSEEIWKKANPGLGVIIKESYFKQQFKKAEITPSFTNTFKRLHLNIWTGSESLWISDHDYMMCNIAPIEPKKLAKRDCFAGLDLASTRDISALVLIFPDEDGNFDVLPYFFLPESKVKAEGLGDGVDYQTWVDEGYIIETPGNVQDYNYIEQKFKDLAEEFNIISCAFDRWGASQLVVNLINDGAKMNPIGMGFVSLSAPTKMLEKLILSKQINHGGNPVLRWMVNNVHISEDPAGNIKPNKAKSTEKIDGVIALVCALAEYLNGLEGDNQSIYEGRGLIFI